MDSLGLILVVVAMLGMALQAGSCLLMKRRPLSVAFLNFFLCILTLFLTIFLSSGALVIAPEFGAVMVQSDAAVWFLRLALVAAGSLPPLCSYRIRQLNRWMPVHLWLRLCVGLAVGIWASTRLNPINPMDVASLHVSMYDVWWPPLVVWLTLSLSQTMLALARIRSRATGFAFAAALVAPLARFALVHQELSDPQSRPWWRFLEPVSLLLAILLVAQVYCVPYVVQKRWRWHILGGLALIEVLAGFGFDRAGGHTKLIFDLIPAVLLLGAVLLTIVRRIVRTATQHNAESLSKHAAFLQRAKRHFRLSRLAGLYFAISVLIIPLGFTDLLSIGALPRDIDILILTVFWLSFSARLAQGVFKFLPQVFKIGEAYLPVVQRVWRSVLPTFQTARQKTVDTAKNIARGNAWLVAAGGVVLTCFALLFLVGVGEALNYHKLVVEPFAWKGAGDDKDKIAERVSDGVVNALGNMRRELLPVLLFAQPTGIHASSARVQPAVLDNGAVQTAVAKSSDLKISNVTIPLSILVDPIQRLVRGIFDIRVVGGSLHKSSNGKQYVVLINADSGETWKVYGDIPAIEADDTAKKTAPDAAKKTREGQSDSTETQSAPPPESKPELTAKTAGSKPEGPACDDETAQSDPLDSLIDQAAFDIANSDPSFIAMGLTKNWKAYSYFRTGLHSWKCFTAYGHWSDLSRSIDYFRQSAQEDSTFAPAEYRLGIAMQSAGENEGAIQALKDSVLANPDLVQAKTAEAQILNTDFSSSLDRAAITNIPYTPDRSSEARSLLASVADLPAGPANQASRRAAYVGLCQDRFRLAPLSKPGARAPQPVRPLDVNDFYPNKFYLNYFYCSRAQALFYELPSLSRQDIEQKRLEASVLYLLGEILNYHDYNNQTYPLTRPSAITPAPGAPPAPPVQQWFCSQGSVDEEEFMEKGALTHALVQGSVLTGHALRYYRQSLALVPDDDYVLCSEATARAYLTHDPETAMRSLFASGSSHFSLANGFLARAGQLDHNVYMETTNPPLAAQYYYRAIVEYQQAFFRSPANFDALNSYANAFWHWSLDAMNSGAPLPFGDSYWYAESYAREAVRIARVRHDANAEGEARDTLGEVLLALGRSEEAVYELRQSLAAEAESFGSDEVRWDLAHALICASSNAGDPVTAQQELAEAAEQYAQIGADESKGELRPFSNTWNSLNPDMRRERCFRPADAKSDAYFPYTFVNTTYENQPGCSQLTMVEARIEGEKTLPPGFTLYVVGGEVYGYAGEAELIPPIYQQHRFYFAQLRNQANALISPMVSFDVQDDGKDARCPHGHVVLNFKLSPPPPPLPLTMQAAPAK